MIPINNSDTAWLIVSDFNQDNNIGFPEELREDIISPDVNLWAYEHYICTTLNGTNSYPSNPGDLLPFGDFGSQVGGEHAAIGGFNQLDYATLGSSVGWERSSISQLVGGNYYENS